MSEGTNKTGNELVVRIADLPVKKQVRLGALFVENAIGTLPMRAVLERPKGDERIGSAESTVELYEGSPGVFVRGELSGELEVGCSRCIEALRVEVVESIAVSYLPASEVPEESQDPDEIDEAEIAEDDVDLYPYEGEAIDLTKLFRERLIMAVPFAPLCKADCKGLCSVCGNNLNENDCGCDRDVLDPRLAPLRDIKLSGTS